LFKRDMVEVKLPIYVVNY